MLHALISFAAETAGHAAEGEESSKTLFYVAAGILAGWAVVLSALGITRADFPSTEGAARGVMALSAVLVAATMASAVITG